MKKKKVITICSSVSFYKDVLRIEKELKKLGFSVRIPRVARVMEKTNNYDVSFYKTWYTNAADYKKKQLLMDAHFKKVVQADAILVVNNGKNGLAGYIGGNVLMEMALAYYLKKPIFLYNDIEHSLPLAEEVLGLYPVVLQQDLTRVKSYFA